MADQTAQNNSNGGASPIACHFPGVRAMTSQAMRPMALRVNLSHLQDLERGVNGSQDVACVLRAAWALVLQYYMATEEVCFGYEESPGGLRAIRTSFDAETTFGEVMERMKGESAVTAQETNGDSNNESEEGVQQPSSTLYDTAVVLRVKSRLTGANTATSSGTPHVALALPKTVSQLNFPASLYFLPD
jgi:hypothetical protein